MPSLRPLLPFTPSTTFSHRDIEQGVGRSPRTPRLDAAFLAVPMRGVVLPGRFSTSPRDFSRFEQTTTSKQPARAFRQPPRGNCQLVLHASARSSSGRPSASAGLGRPRPIGRCVLAGRPHQPCFPHRHMSEPYVTKQLPGAVVSEATRQSGLSSMSMASDVSHHAQHSLRFKHCAAPTGPRHTGTLVRWNK